MKSLDSIGITYGTDKSSFDHNYLKFYEPYFEKYRNSQFYLAEVGIYHGASIKMWEEYFPKAKILAFDIENKRINFKRASVIIGDASNSFLISETLSKYNPFIFIEDGSHFYSQQIATFEEAFLYILPGGFYVCEDIQVCFGKYRQKSYNDQPLDTVTYFNQLSALVCNNGENADHPALKNITKRQIDIAAQIEFIIFYKHLVFLKKKSVHAKVQYEFSLTDNFFNSKSLPLDEWEDKNLCLINNSSLIYQIHSGYIGWLPPVFNNCETGSYNQKFNIQSIIIDSPVSRVKLSYSTFTLNDGWSKSAHNGEVSGSVGKSLNLNGIKIAINNSGFILKYRIYADNWSKWYENGTEAISESGFSAIQINLIFRN